MKADYPPCLKRVLAYEGSEYTDGVHPYDPGGPTKYGITIPDIPGATATTIKNLTVDQVEPIYKTKYWDKVRGDDQPAGLDETVFDYGVNSGIGRAGKVLRACVGLPTSTSVINDEVLAAVAKRDVKALITTINDERLRFLQSLPIWPTYKNGWTTRVHDVESFSLALASAAPTTEPVPTPTPGKAHIPPPTSTKTVIKQGGTVGPVVVGATFKEWVIAHPYVSVAIAAGIVAAIVGVIYLIDRNHKAKQETPMPVTPVPAKA